MEEIVVRKLNKKDINQIIDLRIKLQQYDSIFNGSEVDIENLQKNTKFYLRKELDKNLFLFGTFEFQKLVSICGFNILYLFPTQINVTGKVCYICNVFTLEEYRNKGFQTKTFEYCLSFAKEMGLHIFKLSSMNPIAIDLYKKQGFKFDDHAMIKGENR